MISRKKMYLLVLVSLILLVIFEFNLGEIAPKINLENRFAPSSFAHPFGTDELGKDVLLVTLLGINNSFKNIFGVFFVSAIVGLFLGVISSLFYGKLIDTLIVLLSESLRAFPGLLLVLTIVSLGGGIITALLIYFWIPF